jgi:hypothetical protein
MSNQLICNGCLAPIELGRSFTWYMNKPYHNHCAVSQPLITRAEADAMVAAERAIWTRAIETYFDATAVMDVETHVAAIRKGETP